MAMREKLFILFGSIFVILALIGLNAASFVQKDTEPDQEIFANRSTFNSGATGTRALFDLLSETGRKVSRWQVETSRLLTDKKKAPQTFVVVGPLLLEFNDQEFEQLFRWVTAGGRLVVIDREPDSQLIATTANWKLSTAATVSPHLGLDPTDVKQMTEKTPASIPTTLSVLTQNVNAVQSSRFASALYFEFFPPDDEASATPTNNASGFETYDSEQDTVEQPPPMATVDVKTAALTAPVVHFSNGEINLVTDFPFGEGRIIVLTDPYVISNSGIPLADNVQLAMNIFSNSEGTIAFDEYHHGYGSGQNQLIGYFSGTPVVAIFAQLFLIIGAVLFTQSRRFARALPGERALRLAKLEYVSAMAELEQHTSAYDLAVENIYKDFRRRAARSVGLDPIASKRRELAEKIAERANVNPQEVYKLFTTCENIIHGDISNNRETLSLIKQIRELEKALKLKRASR